MTWILRSLIMVLTRGIIMWDNIVQTLHTHSLYQEGKDDPKVSVVATPVTLSSDTDCKKSPTQNSKEELRDI